MSKFLCIEDMNVYEVIDKNDIQFGIVANQDLERVIKEIAACYKATSYKMVHWDKTAELVLTSNGQRYKLGKWNKGIKESNSLQINNDYFNIIN